MDEESPLRVLSKVASLGPEGVSAGISMMNLWEQSVTESFGPLLPADAASAEGALAPAEELGAMEREIDKALAEERASGALPPADGDGAMQEAGRRRRRVRGGAVTRSQFAKALAATAAAAQQMQTAAAAAAPRSANIIGFAIRKCLAHLRMVPDKLDKLIATILKVAAKGAQVGALTYAVLHPTIITGPAKFLMSLVITLEKAVSPKWSTLLPEYGLALSQAGSVAKGLVEAGTAYPAGALFFAAAYYASRAEGGDVMELIRTDAAAAKAAGGAAAKMAGDAMTGFIRDIMSLADAESAASKAEIQRALESLHAELGRKMAERGPGARAPSRPGDGSSVAGRRTRRHRRHRPSAPTRKARRSSYGGRKHYTRPRRG
jgi:hypothetical protein